MTFNIETEIPELAGLPLSDEDAERLRGLSEGTVLDATVSLSGPAVQAIIARIGELMEIARQNALLAEDEV